MRLRAQGLVHRLVVVYNPRECIILIGATNQLLLREEFADPEDMVVDLSTVKLLLRIHSNCIITLTFLAEKKP